MGIIADIKDDLDKGALRLIAEYRDRLRLEAVDLCGNETDAEDLVSRTIERAVRKIGDCKSDESLWSWMKSIMANLHRDDYARAVNRGTVPVDAKALELAAGSDMSTDDWILLNSDRDALREALKQLDPEYRKSVAMYYFNELTLKEIATLLGSSTSSVARRLELARQILAAKMGATPLRKTVTALLAAVLFASVSFAAVKVVDLIQDTKSAAVVEVVEDGNAGEIGEVTSHHLESESDNSAATDDAASLPQAARTPASILSETNTQTTREETQMNAITKAAAAAVLSVGAVAANAVTYTWNGGTSGSWCEAANWLADGEAAVVWPSTTGDRVEFAADSTATVDLGGETLTCGVLKVLGGATVEIANGTLNFDSKDFKDANHDANVLAGATLRFRAVTANVRRISGDAIGILYGAKANIEVLEGSTFNLPTGAWLPNAGGGRILICDSALTSKSEIQLGYYSGVTRTGSYVNEDLIVSNSTVSIAGNFTFCHGGSHLLLQDSTMTVGGGIRFWYLAAGSGWTGPVLEFSGDSRMSATKISYHEYYNLGEKWIFNVASDEPVVSLSGDSESIGTGSKLNYPYITVSALEGWQTKYPAGVTVPLIACTGTFGVPSTWSSADRSRVTLGEDVGSFFYDAVARRVLATLVPKGDPSPKAELAGAPQMESTSNISARIAVMGMGVGAASYSVTGRLYSDADRTQLIQTKLVEASATECPQIFTAYFDNLTLNEMYYGALIVRNDLGCEAAVNFEMEFKLPSQEGDDYIWKGYGDGESVDDPYNWGVSDAYPSNETANLVFPVQSVASIDLGQRNWGVGLIKMYAGANVKFRNGTLSVRDMLQVNDVLGSGNNRLEFDGVDFTRTATSFFVYGSFNENASYGQPIASKCTLAVVNGSVFRVPDGSSVKFIFGSEGGTFLFEDSIVYMESFIPSTWGANKVDGRIVNSKVICCRKGGNISSNSFFSEVPLYLKNAEFSGFVGSQLVANGITCEGATVVCCENSGGTFTIDPAEKALAMAATADGFPRCAVTGGGLKVNTKRKLTLSQVAAGCPKRNTWVLFEADGGVTVPGTWKTGPLDQCGAFCDYSGFAKPERYTLLIESNRVALKYPGRGMMILIH